MSSNGKSVVTWDEVQGRFGDVSGARGIELRQKHYSAWFLRFGRDVIIEEGCRFYHPDRIVLDDGVGLNIGCLCYGSGGVRLGRNVRCGPRTFIHSANHQIVGEDPRAFHERGYDYRAVDIGANSLISANVSILPGACVGAGCFIACGAVVTAGHYPSGARLAGLPARLMHDGRRESSARWSDIVEIALVTPAGDASWDRHIDQLRSVLGMPQLIRINDHEPLPLGVHTALLIGGASEPATEAPCEFWRLVPGVVTADAECRNARLTLPDGTWRDVATGRPIGLFPIASRDAPVSQRIRHLATWLNERLCKRSDPLPLPELHEWIVAIRLMDLAAGRRDRLLEHLLGEIRRRWPTESPPRIPRRGIHGAVERDRLLGNWVSALKVYGTGNVGRPSGRTRAKALVRRGGSRLRQLIAATGINLRPGRGSAAPHAGLDRKEALVNPGLMLWHALEALDNPEEARSMRQLLTGIVPHCNSSLRLVAALIGARVLGLAEVERDAALRLDAREWWPSQGCIPRQLPTHDSLLLSPLLLTWWALDRAQQSTGGLLEDDILEPLEQREPLFWSGFLRLPAGGSDGANGGIMLVDETAHLVSDALLENWRRLHSASCPSGFHLKIQAWAYGDAVESLEALWAGLIAWLQRRRGRALLRLTPWPFPYTAALSLRYDVDRPIGAQRIASLGRLQSRYANAAFGSWFFRAGDPDRHRLGEILRRLWQETCVHVESPEDSMPGEGVTHHSAPTSLYWQGDTTTCALIERGASYGEFLASGLPTPRPILCCADPGENPATGVPGELMATPLHFPLEGGTQDQGLAYFDRHLEAFRRRLSVGGHAIIGSHPDLDQQALIQLLQREYLDNVWLAPVGEVVRRCLAVMSPGAVRLLRPGDRAYSSPKQGDIFLVATRDVADLQIKCIAADGTVETRRAQLAAGMPRPMDGLPVY
jgi:acetyltransferase-like isoleucine patch superfamily enzyme